jgi:hypothetical protein
MYKNITEILNNFNKLIRSKIIILIKEYHSYVLDAILSDTFTSTNALPI